MDGDLILWLGQIVERAGPMDDGLIQWLGQIVLTVLGVALCVERRLTRLETRTSILWKDYERRRNPRGPFVEQE